MTKARGIPRLVAAAGYSWAGLVSAWRNEAAFRQEIIASVVLIPLAIWLGDSSIERALLIGSWMIVIIAELLNSAVEAVVDRVSLERHPLAGRAKDLASAAVLVALFNAGAVWLLVILG